MKKLIGLFLFFTLGCGKPTESTVATQEHPEVGPFTVQFAPTDQSYLHHFKVNIDQDEGKVEYYITTAADEKVEIKDIVLKVTGCPANQISHQMFWAPDSAQNNFGYQEYLGDKFQTTAKVKGVFIHSLKNMRGCTAVDLMTKLTKYIYTPPHPEFTVGHPCPEASTSDQCKVKLYCREKNPLTSYYEFEAWKRGNQYTLSHFYNHGDGTRGLLSSNSANESSINNETKYTSSNFKVSLNMNLSTGDGIFTDSSFAPTMTYSVECAIKP